MFVEHQSTSGAKIDCGIVLHKSGIALFFDNGFTVQIVLKRKAGDVKLLHK
jgi:hypothetical protein